MISENGPFLPGLAPSEAARADPSRIGPVEQGVIDAEAKLRADGFVDDRHAHIIALARQAARDFDFMPRGGKAYANAQMVTALSRVFELLPQPEMQSADAVTELAEMLREAAR